mgnify:FL=1
MLNTMGGHIEGAGSDTILVYGVAELHDCSMKVSGDRIVAATYLMAAAACGGEIMVTEAPCNYMNTSLAVLEQMGCKIRKEERQVEIHSDGNLCPVPYIRTEPYPGFPTDVQSQLMAALCFSKGRSVIEETIFEDRFHTALELKKMGADIIIEGRRALIYADQRLCGADVEANDLRGGAALVIAGLAATGRTRITSCQHIFRGYARIDTDIQQLGANIVKRVDETEENRAGI